MTFKSFSDKQLLVLRWWALPEYKRMDAIICDGSVRSGKTVCMSMGFICWAMSRFKNSDFALCGKTITSLRRNIAVPLMQTLKTLGFECQEKISRNYIDISLGNLQNRFYLFGGRDESSAALIQGMTLSGVLLDEVALMPRSFVEQALARCSITGSKMWFNCNPDHPYHWFYREWICHKDKKNALYLHFTMNDNPGLSDDVRKRYERLYAGVFYERFVLGKWAVSDGLIYPMFSETRHVVKECPECDRYIISCDYGTVNPCSCGLWGHCDGVWYRINEYYYDARKAGHSRTDEEHYNEFVNLAGNKNIETLVIDPSAASMIACIERHGKFRVVRANNSVLSGIQNVSDALQNDRIKFHFSCNDILREFGLYCWDTSSAGDAPRKEYDHAMDDMRYFVTTILCQENKESFFAISIER